MKEITNTDFFYIDSGLVIRCKKKHSNESTTAYEKGEMD